MKRARTTGARPKSLSILTFAAVLSAGLVLGLPASEAAKGKAGASGADQLIKTGVEALEAGRVDLAVQELTSAITGGKIAQPTLARALYYRGLAYRKQKRPAQAIADFTSALWIKNGLDGQQRADALTNRAAAYRDAGLADQAEADERRVAASRRAETARSASTGSPQGAAPAAPAASSSSGGGLGSFFSALFGGSSAAEQPARQEFATSVSAGDSGGRQTQGAGSGRSPEVSAWSNKANSATAGWADSTVVRKASATRTVSRPNPSTTASTGESAAAGQFVQVAAVRSRAEAQAVATRLSTMGATSGARDATIDEAVMGNMGTLYRVRLGPFASSNDLKRICPQLRNAGLDCMVVSR